VIDLSKYWYKKKATWLLILLPLEYLFRFLVKLNKKKALKHQYKPSCPLIVVGNITVGGTGKSPLSIALIQTLQREGYKVGVVSRGYGSKLKQFPHHVKASDSPKVAADEPLMIVQNTGVNLIIDPDRVSACQYLLAQCECDVIISDDGLQHYKMGRDIEIAVVDGTRGFGNKHCLPVGPLREPIERLNSVNHIIVNGSPQYDQSERHYSMVIEPQGWYRVSDDKALSIAEFNQLQSKKGIKVRALAGIGNPARFFTSLENLGIAAQPHEFSDHHQFEPSDFEFKDASIDDLICMTQKDAVKCKTIAPHNSYYLKIGAKLDPLFVEKLLGEIQQLKTTAK
jgi:tetraacyldisaccharide 4'-kinase